MSPNASGEKGPYPCVKPQTSIWSLKLTDSGRMIACWPTLIKSPDCETTAVRQVKLHVASTVG